MKDEFLTQSALDNNALIAKDLFSLLLPKFIIDNLDKQNIYDNKGATIVIDNVDDVAILFCDIADFDNVVRNKENDIVKLLDKIFKRFDDLCNKHGVQKIETVGKTYMAASGIVQVEQALPQKLKEIGPTLRILNMAKDFMDEIEKYEGLKLKIGIHYGKPVMGVIGYHKPQFSLIGDVVNTTSRHCTTGEKKHIMISEAAWRQLGNATILSGGYIKAEVPTEMKGKGVVTVYHLFKNHEEKHGHTPGKSKQNILRKLIFKVADSAAEDTEGLEKIRKAVRYVRKRNLSIIKASTLGTKEQVNQKLDQNKFMSNLIKAFQGNVRATTPRRLTGGSLSLSPRKRANMGKKNGGGTSKSTAGDKTNSGFGPLALKNMQKVEGGATPKLDKSETGIKKSATMTGVSKEEEEEERLTQAAGEEQENELLIASKSIQFKKSQFDLVRKFNINFAINNRKNAVIFLAVLLLAYGLEVILYFYYYTYLSDLNVSKGDVYNNVLLLMLTLRFRSLALASTLLLRCSSLPSSGSTTSTLVIMSSFSGSSSSHLPTVSNSSL